MRQAVTHIVYLDEAVNTVTGQDLLNQIQLLLTGLAGQNIDVELFALYQQFTPQIEALFSECERGQVSVTPFEIQPGQSRWQLFHSILPYFRQRNDRILHVHIPITPVPVRAAALWARPVASVAHVHHIGMGHILKGQSFLTSIMNGFTTCFLAISDEIKRLLTTVGGQSGMKVYITPYCVKPPDILVPRETARQYLGLHDDWFVIGYAGRLTRQKNISLIFDALAHMEDPPHLCLIGSGEDEDYLRRRAAESGLENVHFVTQKDRMLDMISAFDLMVMPSRLEETGLVLIEAMLRMVPVAAYQNPIMTEILGSGLRGYLFENAHELQHLIARVRKDPKALSDTAQNAYHDVLGIYTVNRVVSHIKHIYQHVSRTKEMADDVLP